MPTRWILAATVLCALALVADGVGSAYTLSRIASRPLVLVEEGGEGRRLPLWQPAGVPSAQPPGTARALVGVGVTLGQSIDYALPDGSTVSCTHRLAWAWCDPGWRVESAPA